MQEQLLLNDILNSAIDRAAPVVLRCRVASEYRALGGCRKCVALDSPFMSVSSTALQHHSSG
jgi:hypothetical protein